MGWYCNVIAVDPVDPDVVWAAGVDLFRSDDGGRSWGLASYWWARDLGPSFVHADQHAIVFHPDYDGVSNTSMFSATDGGETWSSIDGHGATAVPDIPVHSIVVDPANPERLYIGTDLGVFTTINGGRTWAVENNGFANVVTEWLTLGTDGHGEPWLFAFTHGRGAFKVRLNPLPPTPLVPTGRRRP
jgi:photosystem II stability/assembly factor-like uncharacterized protein